MCVNITNMQSSDRLSAVFQSSKSLHTFHILTSHSKACIPVKMTVKAAEPIKAIVSRPDTVGNSYMYFALWSALYQESFLFVMTYVTIKIAIYLNKQTIYLQYQLQFSPHLLRFAEILRYSNVTLVDELFPN